ncbi:MAG TPA: peptidylprolyl isomerase [Bacteroidetes bacterium]|nr:peptidylprolyl isomerase [Bacteroidota bacterium]
MKQTIYIFLFFLFLGFTSCNSGPKKALIETNFGNIEIELYDSTPKHRDNFIKLVKQGFYDSLLFHRVINDFMIQGGDPESKNAPMTKRLGGKGTGYTIPPEFGELHYRGALAAARKPDQVNPGKESSGSQFYIIQGKKHLTEKDIEKAVEYNKMNYTPEQIKKYLEVGGYPYLDNNYTVFGKVIKGMDVVDKIAQVNKGMYDRPTENIIMKIKMLN